LLKFQKAKANFAFQKQILLFKSKFCFSKAKFDFQKQSLLFKSKTYSRHQKKSSMVATTTTMNNNNSFFAFSATMVVATSDHLLHLGLELVGFKTRHIQRTRYTKNLSRFRSAYGVGPETVAHILHDLSHHGIEEEPDTIWLLIALNWMRVYNTEEFMEGVFDRDEKTLREHIWKYVLAVRQLKDVKVCHLLWSCSRINY
jgi:hypothetical protein